MTSASVTMPQMMSSMQMGWDYMRQKPGQKNRRKLQTKRRKDGNDDEENVQGKIAIVTGSNSGLGKQAAFELGNRGAIVIMACRDLKKAEEARQEILRKAPNAQLIVMKLDLGDLASIRDFANKFKEQYSHINILVENAGLSLKKMMTTKDGFEMNFGVNYLGHFLLTLLLLDHLKQGVPSRIVCVSSAMLQLGRLKMDDLMMQKKKKMGASLGLQPYSNSKLAQALFLKELAKRLHSTGITVYGLCPGMVKTDVTRNDSWFFRATVRVTIGLAGFKVKEGCETLVYCAVSKEVSGDSGKMYRFLGHWASVDKRLGVPGYQELAKALWDESERLVGWPISSSIATEEGHHDDDERRTSE